MINSLLKITALFLVISLSISAAQAQVDSLPAPRVKNGKLTVVNRFNTGSMFFFTGVVASNKPSFDTKFNYTYKTWGAMFFKSFEMDEQTPAINYALVVLSKRFNIGKRLMISPQIGTQLNQNGELVDKTSDILTNLAIAYKFGKYITVSNDAVFQNLVFTNKENWTNRFKVLFQKSDFTVAALLWDRNSIFHNSGYSAAGIDLGYNGVKLSSTMNLLLGAQSISVFRETTPRKDGFMVYTGIGF